MNVKNNETLVKENYYLERGHTTAFTQNVSDPTVALPPKLVFDGTISVHLRYHPQMESNTIGYQKTFYLLGHLLELVNALMSGGNKRSCTLKQTCS